MWENIENKSSNKNDAQKSLQERKRTGECLPDVTSKMKAKHYKRN